ncbi:hypothetical protein ACV8SN_20075, partial [Citrobacter portucalensis]
MTTNHPAHGPVSLDRLHQISEILSKAAAQSDGGNLGYAMADAVKVIDGVLAGRNTEPVAYMTYKGYLLHAADPKLAEYSDPTPLYDAPPSPVVPEPATVETTYPDVQTNWRDAKIYAAGWNACRAAMLQSFGNSEQLNSPVIPDGWKLVPIDPTKDMLRAGQSVVGFWLNTVHCYSKMLAAAPAAPQQEAENRIQIGKSEAKEECGLAPIFPYTFYHLTHDWFVAADIPVANDTPVHYADAIRCNVR